MSLKFTTACIIGITGVVLGITLARAQAPKQPSLDESRKAVSSLRGGYQLVAMMMVVDQFPLPQGVAPELKGLLRQSLGDGGALR